MIVLATTDHFWNPWDFPLAWRTSLKIVPSLCSYHHCSLSWNPLKRLLTFNCLVCLLIMYPSSNSKWHKTFTIVFPSSGMTDMCPHVQLLHCCYLSTMCTPRKQYLLQTWHRTIKASWIFPCQWSTQCDLLKYWKMSRRAVRSLHNSQ